MKYVARVGRFGHGKVTLRLCIHQSCMNYGLCEELVSLGK